MKTNKHIVIVRSNIKRLSSLSQVSSNALEKLLRLHFKKVSVVIVNNPSDLGNILLAKPDVVFVGMCFVPSDKNFDTSDASQIWVSQYLEQHGISYTGSSSYAHYLEINKALAKNRILSADLNTSAFFVVKQNSNVYEKLIKLEYPMFIKPLDRGGGLGIDDDSVAHNFNQLISKVRDISSNYESDSLVEEYLGGREFSVAILRNENTENYQAMPIELVAPKNKRGDRILGGLVKNNDTESHRAVTDKKLNDKLSDIAIKMFLALGASDYGRIDIRLDGNGVPQFLEANLIPSLMEGYGNFPKACLLNKLDFVTIILRIVKLASDSEDRKIIPQPLIAVPTATV